MNNEKIDNFLKEYEALTKKHGVDFVAYPEFVPNEKGTFQVVVKTIPVEVVEKKQKWFK